MSATVTHIFDKSALRRSPIETPVLQHCEYLGLSFGQARRALARAFERRRECGDDRRAIEAGKAYADVLFRANGSPTPKGAA